MQVTSRDARLTPFWISFHCLSSHIRKVGPSLQLVVRVCQRQVKRIGVKPEGETKLFFSNSDVFTCTLVHVYELLDSKGSLMKGMKGKLLVSIIQSSRFVVTARAKVRNVSGSVCMKTNLSIYILQLSIY